ncbi:GspE/PulE family protein [Chitinibacter sp. GC72]|uniref:GspE/PulE family protein n=1 Tax=Chitinibacter sp. GC72 TaxID=1526917 RepID=UPI0012FCE575|nr:GspE/PulE family protein [Chitinibacter sp. GC72]
MTETLHSDHLEQLRRLVCLLYPDNKQVADLAAVGSIASFWRSLAHATENDLESLHAVVAKHLGMECVTVLEPQADALDAIPSSKARESQILPLYRDEEQLVVAVANPCDEEVIDFLRFGVEGRVKMMMALPEDLESAIQFAYSRSTSDGGNYFTGSLVITSEVMDFTSDQSLVKLAKELIRETIRLKASDLHIQPFLGGGAIRVRVDGIMHRIALLPAEVYEPLCRYFKALASMDPTNERIPQDGRIALQHNQMEFDLRVSSLPARDGERIVVRFLEQNKSIQLSSCGFAIAEMQCIRKMANQRSGLILITGPTGSGKTSTLASLLRELNTVQRTIITVENPVEYVIPGISQVDVNDKAGLTFASALRSALRQDPDVLLIGEIRDEETAAIALQAAMTGHLVFSTLHTNDAWSAINRLVDLGCKPTLLAEALSGIVAQRLARRLCKHCQKPVQAPLSVEEQEFERITGITPPFRPVGCPECNFSGYQGRFPICEIIEITGAIRQQIARGGTELTQRPEISLSSLNSMTTSAMNHIATGHTTVDEAISVLGQHFWLDLALLHDCPPPDVIYTELSSGKTMAAGVLVISRTPSAELSSQLENAGFSVFFAPTARDACQLLKSNNSIVMLLGDIGDDIPEDNLILIMQDALRHLAWSRLPAITLLPAGLEHCTLSWRTHGIHIPYLTKPMIMGDLECRIRMALGNFNGIGT